MNGYWVGADPGGLRSFGLAFLDAGGLLEVYPMGGAPVVLANFLIDVERGTLTADGRCSQKVGATLGASSDIHGLLIL